MYESINEHLRTNFYNNPGVEALLQQNETEVLANRRSSFIAARDVLDYYFKSLKESR
jgi:LAO/AO transport system kinase